jgi:TolB-like protein/DNA-binding SARP family transcriptional activator
MDSTSALDNGIEGPARWSLRLFGGFELNAIPSGERVALPGKRERVLLAYLALSPNCRQPRRKLAALLWGGTTDETLLDNLRNCLWGLRKALGDTEHRVLASEGEDIVLDAAAFDVDALAFRCLAVQSGRTELEEAANLCSEEFLDGLDIDSEEFESWRRAEATRYRDQAVDVLTRLMTQSVECGETERAIETGLRILRLEPLHESGVRRLMRLYGAGGRRGAAVQLYRTLADALKTELGAHPEAETRAVFAELARGGEDLTSDVPGESGGAPAADAKLPARSTVAAVLGDASGESPPPSAHQLAPTDSVPRPVAPQHAKTRKLGWILAGTLAAVVATFLVYQFAPRAGTTTAQQELAQPAGAISIAVLPFVNLSSDKEQEFFSDGMTEEITSALAKVPNLRVVGRTSAFQFKGQNKDLRAIGQALNATHLIEGSVRKDGNEVRITAQLIKADDGTHLWTESYNRELKGIFAMQEDIAEAIAGALRVPLGLKPGENLVSLRPKDVETYELFLRGRAAYRARRVEEAIGFLDQVVVRDPNFASGWRFLVGARNLIDIDLNRKGQEPRTYPESQETLARRVIALAPGSADGYVMLANLALGEKKFLEALAFFEQALARDPDDPEVMNGYANILWYLGYLKEALAVRERQHVIEPLIPVYNTLRGEVLAANGMLDKVVREWLAQRPNMNGRRRVAPAYARLGRFNDAIDVLLQGDPQPGFVQTAATQAQTDAAVQVLRAAANKTAPPARLPDFEADLWWVYAYTPTPERMLDFIEKAAKREKMDLRYVWWPLPSSLRKTERFKTLVRNAGLVDIWRTRGWPDLCRSLGADDFVCD